MFFSTCRFNPTLLSNATTNVAQNKNKTFSIFRGKLLKNWEKYAPHFKYIRTGSTQSVQLYLGFQNSIKQAKPGC